MLGELLFFHVVLVYKDMTTYDYIMAQSAGNAARASASDGASGARAALCRSTRVVDESTATPKKPKVSLNPCKACETEKLQGDPRSWGSSAIPAATSGYGLAPQQQGAITMPAHGMIFASKHLDAAAQQGGSSQLQSPSPTGYYPVVTEQRQIGYPGPHQPLGESTFYPSQGQPYPHPPSSYVSMLQASAIPAVFRSPPQSALMRSPPVLSSRPSPQFMNSPPIPSGSPGPLPMRSPPMMSGSSPGPLHMHPPLGGSGRHIGSRAATPSASGILSSNPSSPTISASPSRGASIHFVPSAASGRYSYNGQMNATNDTSAFDSRMSNNVPPAGGGGMRFTSLASSHGDRGY